MLVWSLLAGFFVPVTLFIAEFSYDLNPPYDSILEKAVQLFTFPLLAGVYLGDIFPLIIPVSFILIPFIIGGVFFLLPAVLIKKYVIQRI